MTLLSNALTRFKVIPNYYDSKQKNRSEVQENSPEIVMLRTTTIAKPMLIDNLPLPTCSILIPTHPPQNNYNS